MANWCNNCFVVYGNDQKLLRKFYEDMKRGFSEEFSQGSDRSSNWLGNLFLAAGYPLEEVEDHNKIQCRGTIDCIYLDEEKEAVFLDTSTAWTPNDESMEKMIKEKYPGLHILYRAMEFGCDLCETNDREGKFFPERYFIDATSDSGKIPEIYEPYMTSTDVIKKIAEIANVSEEVIRAYYVNSPEDDLSDIDWDDYLVDLLGIDRDEEDVVFQVHRIEVL